jgi:hypothetical protein
MYFSVVFCVLPNQLTTPRAAAALHECQIIGINDGRDEL